MKTMHTKASIVTLEHSRCVERIVKGVETNDGAGVRLTRLIDTDLQSRLDPFLMLDEFSSTNPDDYVAGFPEHPHRGFETVTYLLTGSLRHRDSLGNEGVLQSGDMQWLTAGRGVIHSEMPQQVDGLLEGFQLWINLPAREKMCLPAYQDVPADRLPRLQYEGVTIIVIAGSVGDVHGIVGSESTLPMILDIRFSALARIGLPVRKGHNAFAYVYRGEAEVAGCMVANRRIAILANDADGVVVEARGETGLLLFAARPIGEPVVQYGPIVMNTEREVLQAVAEFHQGTFLDPQ